MGCTPWPGFMVVLKNKGQERRILARNRCSNLIRKVRYGAITDRSEKLLDQEFVNSGPGGGKKACGRCYIKFCDLRLVHRVL